jgi:hypothetical protein
VNLQIKKLVLVVYRGNVNYKVEFLRSPAISRPMATIFAGVRTKVNFFSVGK